MSKRGPRFSEKEKLVILKEGQKNGVKTNENDSDQILTQVSMTLPENRVEKPSSRTPGAHQTNPQHHLPCSVCNEFCLLRAGKSAGGFGCWGAMEQLWNAFHNCSYGKRNVMEGCCD